MTFDECAVVLAKLVSTTSDVGSMKIQRYCNGSPYQKLILKEFIYAKAFIALLVCLEAANSKNMNEVVVIKELMFQNLKDVFESDSLGLGTSFSELDSRFEHYLHNVENFNNVTREFISFVGVDKLMPELDPFQVVSIMQDTKQWMTDSMDKAQNGSNSGSCYVATATYQNSFHPNVVLLRDFRDRFLRKSFFGRLFIDLYYKIGPSLSYLPEHYMFIRRLSKMVIDRIVLMIRSKYY